MGSCALAKGSSGYRIVNHVAIVLIQHLKDFVHSMSPKVDVQHILVSNTDILSDMQLMAEEQGLEVSLDGFNQCMEQQRERSRVS